MRTTEHRAGGMRHRAALVKQSRIVIKRASRGIALVSNLLDKPTRERAWLLYAWYYRCNEIANTTKASNPPQRDSKEGQKESQKERTKDRLKAVRVLTERALDGLPTADMAFDAFGLVAQESRIPRELANDVVAGFAFDAREWRPRNDADLLQYCYHAAGSIYVMMALMLGIDPKDEETLDRGCDLGIALELTNIARNLVKDDATGHCYLPMEWLAEQDIEPGQHTKPHHRQELADLAAGLIDLMEQHMAASKLGMVKLPFRSRWAALSAARIYSAIGRKVKARGANAWDRPIYTSTLQKILHIIAAFFAAIWNRPKIPAEMPAWNRSLIKK